MSLSPFDSFQSRFVTYLLNFPRTTPLPGYRPPTSWVHYTTSCNTQSSAPEDGSDHRPKHVELIGIIYKPLLLHLVGVYITYFKETLFILNNNNNFSQHKYFNHCFLFQINAYNVLSTYIYHQLPPTCFGVCYTIYRETFAFPSQEYFLTKYRSDPSKNGVTNTETCRR